MSSAVKIKPVDIAEYLDNEEVIEEYLKQAIEEGDQTLLLHALSDVAKARGMSEVAKKSGLSREGLYKALSSDAKPRYETLQKVLGALGFGLSIKPLSEIESRQHA
ncbi:addiction module antidote protein [Pelistega suis]|uniref:Putative addiction module antidote protein n=1 Tax=Pelistega suis TaxID=1631957 RepID=A0A849P172_9BURK|nr:addiction module antidote protein [Pelistega suis]NOL51140.1 putative addiction module antidote protein [Pelistega suis]